MQYVIIKLVIEMTIKELRTSMNLTQIQASKITNIPLRTYKLYENDESKVGTIKYNHIINKLKEFSYIDEEHGILTLTQIKERCIKVLETYDVEYCYLFGSYAKDKATPVSDVDLLVSAGIKGLKFYGLVEDLRVALKKRVDVLDINQLKDNLNLTEEILKDGLKIYG